MKICATQVMIAILLCGISMAHSGYSQLLDKEITINLSDVTFEKALLELGGTAKVKFAYSLDQLEIDENVSIHADHMSLRRVLDQLLSPYNIKYKAHENAGTISLKRFDRSERDQSSINETDHDFQQFTGTVKDINNQPMAGVNIVVKGTTNGTTSDSDGRFSMNAESGDILVFSFIGYTSTEIEFRGQPELAVVLLEDVKNLNEVVVNAGYWEVKDQEKTGNISRVTADEIGKQPVSNPLQSLQGRIPGVYIQQNTGVPGGGFKIEIRGRNSLRTDGNDPLYVIDGVPFTPNSLTAGLISGSIVERGNPLSTISPSDIESIEILKDADATAVYGSRGANGVVLITTKKGKEGKTKVDVNVSQGIGKVSRMMDLLNTEQYVDMRVGGLKNQGLWPAPSVIQTFGYDIFAWDTTRYTNWQKEFIGGTAHTTNAQLSVSGGNANTSFNIGGNYYRETTVFPGDFHFQRVSGNISLSHSSQNQKFRVTMSALFSTSANRLLPIDLTSLAVTLPPNAPALYTESGNLNWDWKNGFTQNPMANLKKKYESDIDNLIANSMLSYEILPKLYIKTSLGFTRMNVDEWATSPLGAIPPQFLTNQTGSASFGDNVITTWIAEPQLSYSRTYGKSSISMLIGTSFQESEQDGLTLTARGYTNDAMLENLRAASSIETTSASSSLYRYSAIFGRVNYTFHDRYILNLTGRRDGSSRFGPGNRFGNFGAVGLAWIFSKEGFLERSSVLSFGKVRTSYGTTGSDAIGNYQYLDTYSPTTYPYNGTTGLVVTRLDNPNYSWETNRKFEVGLELGVLQDRVQLSSSWYNNRSSNQLVGLPLPVITGQSSVQFNLPATVQNSGLEFLLSTSNITTTSFKWTTSFNLTIPRNKLVEFPNIEIFPAYNNLYQVGESIYTKKTLRSTGVDPATGLYTFEDLNGDGRISATTDGQFLKQVGQQYFGGLNNTISYKGFQLDLFFQFVKQTGYNYINSYAHPGSLSNQPTEVLGRWQESGDVTDIQAYGFSGNYSTAYSNYRFSDAAISDASFIRLKNLSFSWEFPDQWLKKVRITKCKIYVQGQNLFTVTKYLGMDPENQNVNFLPPLRIVTGGFHITL